MTASRRADSARYSDAAQWQSFNDNRVLLALSVCRVAQTRSFMLATFCHQCSRSLYARLLSRAAWITVTLCSNAAQAPHFGRCSLGHLSPESSGTTTPTVLPPISSLHFFDHFALSLPTTSRPSLALNFPFQLLLAISAFNSEAIWKSAVLWCWIDDFLIYSYM